jgi:hypothetical protein
MAQAASSLKSLFRVVSLYELLKSPSLGEFN